MKKILALEREEEHGFVKQNHSVSCFHCHLSSAERRIYIIRFALTIVHFRLRYTVPPRLVILVFLSPGKSEPRRPSLDNFGRKLNEGFSCTTDRLSASRFRSWVQ